jgi:Flp pilus assembly protein TadD
MGRERDVVRLLEPVYQANPEDRAVDYALGTALLRSGDVPKAQGVLDRILKGGSPEASLLLGEAQLAAGDSQKAAITFRSVLDRDPDLPGAWSLYGRALVGTDDVEGAKKSFERALQADANDFDANLHLGAILRRLGDAEAKPYLEKSRKLRPHSPEVRLQMGEVEAALDNLSEARKQLEALAREGPAFQEVHVQLASLYARLNLMQETQRERQIVMKLNEQAREKKLRPAISNHFGSRILRI